MSSRIVIGNFVMTRVTVQCVAVKAQTFILDKLDDF
jgi:hypothetical protein